MAGEPEEKAADERAQGGETEPRGVLAEHPVISRILLLANAAGCMGYLSWLVLANKRIFYTQEGVIYLLPFLPFFFVFIYIFGNPPEKEDEKPDNEKPADAAGATEDVKKG